MSLKIQEEFEEKISDLIYNNEEFKKIMEDYCLSDWRDESVLKKSKEEKLLKDLKKYLDLKINDDYDLNFFKKDFEKVENIYKVYIKIKKGYLILDEKKPVHDFYFRPGFILSFPVYNKDDL